MVLHVVSAKTSLPKEATEESIKVQETKTTKEVVIAPPAPEPTKEEPTKEAEETVACERKLQRVLMSQNHDHKS